MRSFLLQHGFSEQELDWESMLVSEPSIDVMRPRGEWVGVKESDDDVESATAEAPAVVADVVSEGDSTAFESELEPVPDKPGEASPASRKMDVPWNDELVSMEVAVKAVFLGTSKKYSTDRTRRVANMSKLGDSEASDRLALIDSSVQVVQANLDPLMAVVVSQGMTTLVVVHATSFDTPDGKKMLRETNLELMSDPKTTVHAQVLLLKHTTLGEATLTWVPGQIGIKLTLDAIATQAVDPQIISTSDGQHGYSFVI